MNVTNIPFVKHVGIDHKDVDTLQLEAKTCVQNHIQSIHASAQFTLAETQSGLYLQELFPEYVGKVVGVLRGSTVKYKAPAMTSIIAKATLSNEAKEKFVIQLERKGRATLTIDVSVLDEEGTLTMQGVFTWFVQKLDVS